MNGGEAVSASLDGATGRSHNGFSRQLVMDAFDFVNRANADYVDQLYQQYLKDPREVDPQWRAYFAGFDMGASKTSGVTPGSGGGQAAVARAAGTTANEVLQIEIADLVHSYRELGHYVATLDP